MSNLVKTIYGMIDVCIHNETTITCRTIDKECFAVRNKNYYLNVQCDLLDGKWVPSHRTYNESIGFGAMAGPFGKRATDAAIEKIKPVLIDAINSVASVRVLKVIAIDRAKMSVECSKSRIESLKARFAKDMEEAEKMLKEDEDTLNSLL